MNPKVKWKYITWESIYKKKATLNKMNLPTRTATELDQTMTQKSNVKENELTDSC